jgi:hypothetical protein
MLATFVFSDQGGRRFAMGNEPYWEPVGFVSRGVAARNRRAGRFVNGNKSTALREKYLKAVAF